MNDVPVKLLVIETLPDGNRRETFLERKPSTIQEKVLWQQLLGPEGLRNEVQQSEYLFVKKKKEERESERREHVGVLEMDYEAGGSWVGRGRRRVFVPASDIIDAAFEFRKH